MCFVSYLAVLSPEPLASKSVLGFHAQMNTSDSCPLSMVALLAGISIDVSTSMFSGGALEGVVEIVAVLVVGVVVTDVVVGHVVTCKYNSSKLFVESIIK